MPPKQSEERQAGREAGRITGKPSRVEPMYHDKRAYFEYLIFPFPVNRNLFFAPECAPAIAMFQARLQFCMFGR